MKNEKVRELCLLLETKTGYRPDEAEVFEVHYGTPKRSLTTARLRANLRGFRINVSVVCPNPEKAKNRLSLTRSEGDDVTQAINNLVVVLMKHAFGQELPV